MSTGKERTRRITVFGPGMIGGSVALAVKSRMPGSFLTVWGRDPGRLEEIRRRGAADAVTDDPAAAVREADLAVLCTPVCAMEDLARRIATALPAGAAVTDAGSVKAGVVGRLSAVLGNRFVGAHPMAGSERSGFGAARADLFRGAPCILTPAGSTDPSALETVRSFWNSLGSQTTLLSPEVHDRLVAHISHLPHALAFCLVELVSSSLPDGSSLLAGGSFRDATRVASSDPELWSGILLENRTEVAGALHGMAGLLSGLASSLEEGDSRSVLDLLTRAQEHRSSLPLPRPEDAA